MEFITIFILKILFCAVGAGTILFVCADKLHKRHIIIAVAFLYLFLILYSQPGLEKNVTNIVHFLKNL